MPTPPADRLLPDAWGIHAFWVDARDDVVAVAEETVEQLREAMGSPPDDFEEWTPIVTRRGVDLGLGRVKVVCEDGVLRTIDGPVPDDFPYGYHDIDVGDRTRRLIVSPGRCWLPEGWRAWGWTVQLYAARSRSGVGIGDLADLAAIREWAEELGAGFLLVNPLHAVAPTLPQEASPYLPATRRFRNPIYLRVDGVEVGDAGHDPDALIDRDGVWQAKLVALERNYSTAEIPGAFDDWRREQGQGLESFATWCVLAEQHGPDWRDWPVGLRRPDSDGVRRLSDDPEHTDRVRFHAWLQWLLEHQFRDAAGDLAVLQDLPIGVDGGGADAWAWQDTLVDGATVGAPPDIFNAQGQSWGSPPFAPWRLRAANYEPFAAAIRATMAGGGGLRIDHVMGLFRLWWIPRDGSPADGAYVRYPADDLLDIVALESHRARSVVVGEDLGTVEPGVREALAEHAMLSYRLMWFEPGEPPSWPAIAMGAITTHDLPTIAGLWSGSDLEDQVAHVATPRPALERDRAVLLEHLPAADGADGEGAEAVAVAAHRRLGEAPCVLLSATLEDAVGQAPRPNMPGTIGRPNWSIPLPVDVDDLPGHPLATRLAQVLDAAVRRT